MRTFASKAGWVVAALLGVTLLAAWAGIINAGTLDPPGPIGPSMKSLDDVPGSWNRMLSASGADPCNTERFDCVLLDDTAVLDRETGLVWEREWHPTSLVWSDAVRACHDRNTGDRSGWRLPTVAEMLSLLDGDSADGLPEGHPFDLGLPEDVFWTSTRDVTSPDVRAMIVDVGDATVTDELFENAPYKFWCVRGPGGGDVQ